MRNWKEEIEQRRMDKKFKKEFEDEKLLQLLESDTVPLLITILCDVGYCIGCTCLSAICYLLILQSFSNCLIRNNNKRSIWLDVGKGYFVSHMIPFNRYNGHIVSVLTHYMEEYIIRIQHIKKIGICTKYLKWVIIYISSVFVQYHDNKSSLSEHWQHIT